MSESRPLGERPAARPATPPTAAPGGQTPINPVPPQKGGLGCFSIGCLSLIGIVVIAAIIGMIVNAGGGSSSGNHAPAQSANERYVDFVCTTVAKQGHSTSDVSDSALIVLGEQICSAFDGGATKLDVLLTISAQDVNDAANDTAVIAVAGAVTFLCPEHRSKVE